MTSIVELFTDEKIVSRIKNKLPKLFHIADLESQRAGKIGMEVGSIRERIIVSLLIYKFGEENVETAIPITEPEVDVRLFGKPISIKTKSGSGLSGIKLIWTVDAQNAKEFLYKYIPSCDMIFVQINWKNKGYLYCFPVEVQLEVFESLGRDNYIKLPSLGTNPRGVEISSKALQTLVKQDKSFRIEIDWQKEDLKFNAFKRWVDLWAQD